MAPTRIDFDRILCPVDFSEFSGPALERAVRLGDWFDARVEVLHVIPFLPFAMPAGLGQPYLPGPAEVADMQRAQAAESLGTLVGPFLGGGAPIETKVLEGDPWSVIQKEAEALPADLIVIGTHGRGGFAHLLLGSVTEKELRHAPCPVLTVSRASGHSLRSPLFRRILCAADLTATSEHTLEQALALATENAARITLLHVLETYPSAQVLVPSPRDLVEARAELRNTVLEEVRAFCDVDERVETGSARSEILRVAEEVEADLIVMGAHTRGKLGRMFFGSTASQVVRRATCPVLVVHETGSPKEAPERLSAAMTGPGGQPS